MNKFVDSVKKVSPSGIYFGPFLSSILTLISFFLRLLKQLLGSSKECYLLSDTSQSHKTFENNSKYTFLYSVSVCFHTVSNILVTIYLDTIQMTLIFSFPPFDFLGHLGLLVVRSYINYCSVQPGTFRKKNCQSTYSYIYYS